MRQWHEDNKNLKAASSSGNVWSEPVLRRVTRWVVKVVGNNSRLFRVWLQIRVVHIYKLSDAAVAQSQSMVMPPGPEAAMPIPRSLSRRSHLNARLSSLRYGSRRSRHRWL